MSGEQISRTLQVSRTAVWKHIKSLRDDGYIINSQPRVGYRIACIPDRLYPNEIAGLLKADVIGTSILHFETTESTNNIAKDLASDGAPEGLLVIAEEQTRGRGRLGRSWNSPAEKGILISMILRPNVNPIDAPKITLLTSVALARVFEAYPGIRPGIKWPNDIFLNGKKVAGILTEMNAELDRVNYVVVGVGVNINSGEADIPEDLRDKATSLSIETNKQWSRLRFLISFLEEFENLYSMFNNGNYAPVVDEWKRYSITMDRCIRVSSQRETIEGRAVGLDQDGALMLETNEGIIRVVAGEVAFIGT